MEFIGIFRSSTRLKNHEEVSVCQAASRVLDLAASSTPTKNRSYFSSLAKSRLLRSSTYWRMGRFKRP